MCLYYMYLFCLGLVYTVKKYLEHSFSSDCSFTMMFGHSEMFFKQFSVCPGCTLYGVLIWTNHVTCKPTVWTMLRLGGLFTWDNVSTTMIPVYTVVVFFVDYVHEYYIGYELQSPGGSGSRSGWGKCQQWLMWLEHGQQCCGIKQFSYIYF